MLIDLGYILEKYKIEISGVVHVGAHHGQELLPYKKAGVQQMIFVEPVQKNFQILVSMLKQDRAYGQDILAFNYALGELNQSVEMSIESANNGQSCSVLKPKKHLSLYRHIVFDKKETVKMVTLDTIMRSVRYNNVRYNFINMDVQGYELSVLKGGSEHLCHVDYIYTEVNRDEIYENGAKIEELDSFLKQYTFERVETAWYEDHGWGDALYIKKHKLC